MLVQVEEYDKAIVLAAEALRKGEIIIYPTDTLYGLGADATSEKAVEKVRKAKGRDDAKPISIICSGLGMIRECCEVSPGSEETLAGIFPGPYTAILQMKKGKLAKGLGSAETVGVRVPKYFLLLDIVRTCGFPITATSANLSGGKDPCSLPDILEKVKSKASVLIDGGKCHHSAPSTIIDLTGKEPKLLRKGAGEFPVPKSEFDPGIF